MKNFATAVCLTSLISASAILSAQAEEYLFTSIMGPTFPDITVTAPNFSKRISEGTNGRHSLSIHPSGVLAGASVTMTAIADGVADVGTVTYPYYPTLLPSVTLIGDLPGFIPQVSAAATTETILLGCPSCEEEMKEVGVVILTNQSSEPVSLLCREPISSLADAKGVKVRVSGPPARTVAELGMTPVNISFSETYDALTRGETSCTILGAAAMASAQFFDVAKYLSSGLDIGTYAAYSTFTINRDLWESFATEEKNGWYAASVYGIVDQVREAIKANDAAISPAKDKLGVTIVPAQEDLRQSLKTATDGLASSAIEITTGRGVEDAEAIARKYAENVEKWTSIYNEIGSNGAWSEAQWEDYASRLRSEIYDKLTAKLSAN